MKPAQAASTSIGGAGELEPVLQQAGGRGERHVGRERADDDQVDVGRIDAGAVDAAEDGLVAEVAGGLVGRAWRRSRMPVRLTIQCRRSRSALAGGRW